ncbi:helix-turn-helix domain-containing protein [Dysgonomonas capnocytophagoides]|uniref:helix-turn-helix domain-containing protein n=1 Tax=Dysgonomonas capnocytophagoides TaxID=45254 RepID=UPI003340B267
MANLYLEGISMQELEALIRKAVEEVCNNYVVSEGKKIDLHSLNKNQLPDRNLLTRKETAAFLGISLVTLHKWTTQGRLTAYRIETSVRYKADEINNALVEIKCKKFKL